MAISTHANNILEKVSKEKSKTCFLSRTATSILGLGPFIFDLCN